MAASTQSTSAPTLVTLTPNSGTSSAVNFGLVDQTTYGPVTGSGGWQVVDRPKMVSATQWYDRSPFQLVMTVVLDNEITQGAAQAGTSVEADCNTVESWLDPVPNTYLPPTFSISGPVPGGSSSANPKTWVVFSLEFNDAIRDFSTGNRTQQVIKLTLYEYTPPFKNASPASKAASTISASSTTSKGVYTIKKGDTLISIAAKNKHTNSTSAYIAQIKALNSSLKSFRDNATLSTMVGKTIKLPA